jgi:hypothetical protein
MEYSFSSRTDLEKFIESEVLTVSESWAFLGISRQAFNSLVQRGKIKPIGNTKLFFKADLLERQKEAEDLRTKFRPYDKP